MNVGVNNQPNKKKERLIIVLTIVICDLLLGVAGFILGTRVKNKQRIAVDFTIQKFDEDIREPKYKMMPSALSNYICDLSDELGLDSDLVVAILMKENPEFNPDAISRPNENGTLDLGMFQLNDYYLWTTFKKRYWFDNIVLNPFNWKHNAYIALHHIKYLQDKFKIQDDVIMAYNGGEGNVMNGTVKPMTISYLANVKNNLFLLKGGDE